MSLPLSCIPCTKIEDDCYDWFDRHQRKLAEVETKRADIIFIGDSITHFWGHEDNIGYGAEIWDEYYSDRNILNLGFGYDRTQNMLWRILNGEIANQKPKMVVVNAGSNQFSATANYPGDTPEEAFAGVKLLLETLLKSLPDAEFVVMAIFPRLPEETTQRKIDALNAMVKVLIGELAASGNNIRFLDITRQMRHPDGSFNCDLYADRCCHPNNAGYRIWAEALEADIVRILK